MHFKALSKLQCLIFVTAAGSMGYAVAEPAQALTFRSVGFDVAANGSIIDSNTVIDDQYADWGVTFSGYSRRSNVGNNAQLRSFDSDCKGSSCSGRDDDLATGAGNVAGSTTPTEGNLLIIQEANNRGKFHSKADDEAKGGSIFLDFDPDQEFILGTFRLVDIDSNPNLENVSFVATYADNTTTIVDALDLFDMGYSTTIFAGTGTSSSGGLSDNSILDFDLNFLNTANIQTLEIQFKGSGAIASAEFCQVATGGSDSWCSDPNGHTY